MSFKKLEMQKIEELVFQKKKDENLAMITILGEICELKFYRGSFTFRKHIEIINEIDANTITRLSKCLTALNGGLSYVHPYLTFIEDQVSLVMVLPEDEISNIQIHERIINFMCLARYLDEIFTSHS